jgi:hypothetical protein
MPNLPEPLDTLARDVCSFYERIMLSRGTELAPNTSLVLTCDEASLVFQAEALSLGFQIGVRSCRITDRRAHKRKLRTFTSNIRTFQANNRDTSKLDITDHTWNTWESIHIDLTARQFGFQGMYYIGSESFLSDIEASELSRNGIGAMDAWVRWKILENDLPEFRAWRSSGLDWQKIMPWDSSKRDAFKRKFEEIFRARRS